MSLLDRHPDSDYLLRWADETRTQQNVDLVDLAKLARDAIAERETLAAEARRLKQSQDKLLELLHEGSGLVMEGQISDVCLKVQLENANRALDKRGHGADEEGRCNRCGAKVYP